MIFFFFESIITEGSDLEDLSKSPSKPSHNTFFEFTI
jgi:hypothetical protein